jgi:hypothetical protein
MIVYRCLAGAVGSSPEETSSMHLLIILVVVVWIGIALSRANTKQHLVVLRGLGIAILTAIGIFAITIFLFMEGQDKFGLEFFLGISGIAVVGGLVWLVVKLGKVTKA